VIRAVERSLPGAGRPRICVDHGPIALAHACALRAGDGSTVVITADFRDQQAVLS
jgi:hypothetical protein